MFGYRKTKQILNELHIIIYLTVHKLEKEGKLTFTETANNTDIYLVDSNMVID